uniref:Uncharacterized protein n=1 Tax=Glossina palpalis gambiensis TaxID=67801 RepID=A0A1B0AQ03_9MUSC
MATFWSHSYVYWIAIFTTTSIIVLLSVSSMQSIDSELGGLVRDSNMDSRLDTRPLNAFPWVLNGLVESWISIKRVQELIDLPDLDFDSYYDPPVKDNSAVDLANESPVLLQLKNANFEYNSN